MLEDYRVERTGMVYSYLYQKYLKPLKGGNDGYLQVALNSKRHYIHVLVAKLYVFNQYNKKEVNHKDGDKANNHYSNLEWVTRSENIQHAFSTGLKPSLNGICLKPHIIEIFNHRNAGLSIKKIAEKYNVSATTIWKIINNRTTKYLEAKKLIPN